MCMLILLGNIDESITSRSNLPLSLARSLARIGTGFIDHEKLLGTQTILVRTETGDSEADSPPETDEGEGVLLSNVVTEYETGRHCPAPTLCFLLLSEDTLLGLVNTPDTRRPYDTQQQHHLPYAVCYMPNVYADTPWQY